MRCGEQPFLNSLCVLKALSTLLSAVLYVLYRGRGGLPVSAERASRVWRCPWPPPRPRRAAPPRAALQVVAAPPATIHPLQTYQLRRRQRAFRPQHLQVASGRRPSRAQPLPAPRAAPRAPWRRKWHARRARGGTCLLRCTGGAAPPPAIEARQSWEFTPPPAPKIPRAPTRPHARPHDTPRAYTRRPHAALWPFFH